jgi:hypothetical protein
MNLGETIAWLSFLILIVCVLVRILDLKSSWSALMPKKPLERSVIYPCSIRCSCGKTVLRATQKLSGLNITCPECKRAIVVYARALKRCPECGNTEADGNGHPKCDWVYGRRGWRQLGVYDG